MTALPNPHVNLLPTDRFEYSKAGRFLGWMLTTGRFLVVLTELVVITAFIARFWFDRQLTDLREVRVQKEGVIDSFSGVADDFLRVQSQLIAVRNILQSQYGAADTLTSLQALTPQGIVYEQIAVSSASAELQGFAPTPLAFSQLLTNLQTDVQAENVSVEMLQLSPEHFPGFDFKVKVNQAAGQREGVAAAP